MYPIQGQIVKIKAQSNINYIIAETAKGILEHCQWLEPNLKNVEIESIYVGLRPARPAIRLERNGNVIHNYCHGGAGFTVALGCAWAVRDLII